MPVCGTYRLQHEGHIPQKISLESRVSVLSSAFLFLSHGGCWLVEVLRRLVVQRGYFLSWRDNQLVGVNISIVNLEKSLGVLQSRQTVRASHTKLIIRHVNRPWRGHFSIPVLGIFGPASKHGDFGTSRRLLLLKFCIEGGFECEGAE